MNTKPKLFQCPMLFAIALGVGSPFLLQAATDGATDTLHATTNEDEGPATFPIHNSATKDCSSAVIPWSQIGAKAGADYKGDGMGIVPTAEGARLRCVFQRLEGEATREGLWLTSTVTNGVNDRFRVIAADVRRLTSKPRIQIQPPNVGCYEELADTGTVAIDGQAVRFIRPGLTEEYTVSMDGVRQDFLLLKRPQGAGELVINLVVSGANIESAPGGPRLELEHSGRKIAYGRLRATDVSGKELPARIEVASPTTLAVVLDDIEALYPVRIDPTFSDANWISMGGLPGANGVVLSAVADGSGNVYIGGDFTIVANVLATNIAKWNGSNWSPLGSGLGNGDLGVDGVSALAVSGSDLYAGGGFTNAGGRIVNYIAKWNGSNWSALGSGMQSNVSALAVSGSDLYAGGDFTTAGGLSANYIAKWNGSGWSALGSGMGGGTYGYPPSVYALAVTGSVLYAGGYFTTAGGVSATNIAKWDGSSWSALSSGVVGYVRALSVSGTNLYAGGLFTTAGGGSANNIAKWDGSGWSALGSGVNFVVLALAVSGTDLYAGGGFTTAGALPANYIAKWNGSSWGALGSGMDGPSPYVRALAVSGSDLYAGGQFTTADGNPVNYLAKWNGSSWSALGSGMGSYFGYASVFAVAVSGSDLYAGGFFTTVGGSLANNIAKWNGSSWSVLGSGLNGRVYSLAVSCSDLYAGGAFTTAGGSPANYIAKWDGSSWSPLGSGIDNDHVFALAVSGSELYAAGVFASAGGVSVANIAKWNGSSWTALGSGMNSAVYALALLGSNLYAGGYFTTAGGISANHIAKWDGSSWSTLGSGTDLSVSALAVSGSDLYAGGGFTTAGGVSANYIAKWNGSTWSALGSGTDLSVGALAVSGNDLYAGGGFTTAGGVSATNIAKWNGSGWSALGLGINDGTVHALGVSGSDLYVGGDFTTAGGKVSAYVARAIVNPPLLAIESDGFGGYFISFSGVPGSAYRLQRTATLTGPWTNSAPQIASASGQVEFWDLSPPPGQGFYRSVQP